VRPANAQTSRRDADWSDRDGRATLFQLHRSGADILSAKQKAPDNRPALRLCVFVTLPVSVSVFNTAGVLPGVEDVIDDFVHADAVLYLRENERAGAAHLL